MSKQKPTKQNTQSLQSVSGSKKQGKQKVAVAPSGKKPLDQREYPAARDTRGSASRSEIRRTAPSVNAPRQSNRPVERSNQPRRHGIRHCA